MYVNCWENEKNLCGLYLPRFNAVFVISPISTQQRARLLMILQSADPLGITKEMARKGSLTCELALYLLFPLNFTSWEWSIGLNEKQCRVLEENPINRCIRSKFQLVYIQQNPSTISTGRTFLCEWIYERRGKMSWVIWVVWYKKMLGGRLEKRNWKLSYRIHKPLFFSLWYKIIFHKKV